MIRPFQAFSGRNWHRKSDPQSHLSERRNPAHVCHGDDNHATGRDAPGLGQYVRELRRAGTQGNVYRLVLHIPARPGIEKRNGIVRGDLWDVGGRVCGKRCVTPSKIAVILNRDVYRYRRAAHEKRDGKNGRIGKGLKVNFSGPFFG
jgi:hypothetical protein